jgi:hypothetical protein
MDKLNILWTTGNKNKVFSMLNMFASRSEKNDWWNDVNVIIYGASAKLVGTDKKVQVEIVDMISQGVNVEAFKDSCDNFGVTEKLIELGVNVRSMGKPMNEYIQSGQRILTI